MSAQHPVDTPESESLAKRFFARAVLHEVVGRKVKFTRPVERLEFTVRKGSVGWIMEPFMDEGKLVAAVRLASPPSGAEAFDGEVHWKEDFNLLEFEEDVELTD